MAKEVELKIKLKASYAKRFKQHLEEEHPVTRGKMQILKKRSCKKRFEKLSILD